MPRYDKPYPKSASTVQAPPAVTLPPAIEKVYKLVREGSCGNLRVQEIKIQGDQVIERRFVGERDAKPFALAKLVGCIEDQLNREIR